MSDFKIDYNEVARRLVMAITDGYLIAARELSERNSAMLENVKIVCESGQSDVSTLNTALALKTFSHILTEYFSEENFASTTSTSKIAQRAAQVAFNCSKLPGNRQFFYTDFWRNIGFHMAIRQFKSDLAKTIHDLKESSAELGQHEALVNLGQETFDYLFLIGCDEDLKIDSDSQKFLDDMFNLEPQGPGLLN